MLMSAYRAMDTSRIQFDFMVHRSKKGLFEAEIHERGGRIFRMSSLRSRGIVSYTRRLRDFLLDHPEYRVVHSHLNQYSYLPLVASRRAGVPFRIAHSHQDLGSDARLSLPRTLLTQYFRRHLGREATHRFACSSAAGRWLFGEGSSFQVLPNSIDVAAFAFNASERSRIRGEYGFNESFVIGHVGNFSPPKNYPFLLEVLAEARSLDDRVHLLLVGNHARSPDIERLIADKGLGNCVVLAGVQSPIAPFLQAMDAFVFPSVREGLPVSVVEAQAAGLPCFISDAVTREVDVSDRATFLPLDAGPRAWAERVLSPAPDSRVDVADLVRKAGYDVKATAHNLMDFYLNLASDRDFDLD